MKNSAFVYCSHCGDQFFAEDCQMSPKGLICTNCAGKPLLH
nr:MAG TPA: transcription factor [Caudoviricetes sp.]